MKKVDVMITPEQAEKAARREELKAEIQELRRLKPETEWREKVRVKKLGRALEELKSL